MSAAPQTASAAQAVGEYLQSPDDLLKLAAFRKKLEKEKASIDVRLKIGAKEQLDATRDGLRKLLSTRTNLQVIKDEMELVEKMCNNPQNTISTFDQISRVSMVHRNFEQTEEIVNNLVEMNSKVDALLDMLEAYRHDVLGSAPNLLAMHFQINQLEGFRNQIVHQAKMASSDSRNALTRWFERWNQLIEDFADYVLTLASNVLPIVRAGHQEVIVKLIKIAEIEGREDEKAIAIKLVKKAAKLDAASKFKSLQANARVIKHYRSKIMRAITESVKAKFDEAYAQDERDPIGFLQGLEEWMYADLDRIEMDVVPCFPQEYDIYSHYVKEYHKALNSTLIKLLATEPEASVLLELYTWLKGYKKIMKSRNVPPELLEPPLLDGKEQGIIDDYTKLIIRKLDEWSDNLMKTETQEFATRAEPPELDSDGMYGTKGAVILFQMVNQQIDLAIESNQGAILAQVVSEVNRAIRGIQAKWMSVLDTEYKMQVDKPEEVAGGLVEYCIALANDQIKSVEYTEALLGRLEPSVSEKYRGTINERLNNAIDGYLDVAKKCVQILIDLIFNDLKPATKQLFLAAWYDGIMDQIVATMRDYMTDYQSFLNPSLFDLLVDDTLDAFRVNYLTALANSPKLKIPAAVDRIKNDISDVFRFFSAFKPPKELESYFDVVESVLSLLEASKSMVFLSFWSFAKVYGPNITFVECLMRARDDLDRTGVSEIMDSVKRKVKEDGLTDPPEPTIMKKVTIQGALSRLLKI